MKRIAAVLFAVVAAIASLVVPTSVFSQPNDYTCVGPYPGCTAGCCTSADGCWGTCQDSVGNIRDFSSEKNVDLGQNGCIPNSETSCSPTTNVIICYQTFYSLDFCPSDAVVCSMQVKSTSCNLP